MQKQIVLWIATIMLVASTTLTAETVKIGVGNPDGEYIKIIVPAINQVLREHGYTAVAEISAGTQEDIAKLIAGEIPTALSQLDVAVLNMTVEKDPDEKLLLLWGRIAVKALFCVAHKGGNIFTYEDITTKRETPLNVSVGNAKSEIAHTLQYLMKLDPNLQDLKLHYKAKTRIELSRLLSGRRDLVCFMAMPNPENELIKRVMEHDELFFINIEHPAFSDVKIGKNRIYAIMEVPINKGVLGFNPKTLKTVVTWVGIVINEKKLDEDLLDLLSAVVMKPDLLTANNLASKVEQFLEKIVIKIEDAIN